MFHETSSSLTETCRSNLTRAEHEASNMILKGKHERNVIEQSG